MAILVYLKPELVEKVESIIECLKVSRSAFIEHLIEHGLETVQAPRESAIV